MAWKQITGADGKQYYIPEGAPFLQDPQPTRVGGNFMLDQSQNYGPPEPPPGPDVNAPDEILSVGTPVRPPPAPMVQSAKRTPSVQQGTLQENAPVTGDAGETPGAGADYLVVPGTKGGMQVASRSTEGIPDEEKDVLAKLLKQIETGEISAADAEQHVMTSILDKRETRNTNAMLRAEQSRRAHAEELSKAEERAKNAVTQVKTAQKLDVDPSRRWGNAWFALSAFLGGLGSVILDTKNARRGAKTDFAGQHWRTINTLVDQDIQHQRDTNSGLLAAAKLELGDAAAAEDLVRGAYFHDVAKQTQLLEQQAQTDDQRALLGVIRQRAELQAKKGTFDAATKMVDKQTVTEKNVPGTPAHLVNVTEAQITQTLGGGNKDKGLERWNKAMTAKAGSGDGAPTVNQTLATMKGTQQDVQFLEALAKANGGDIPQTGVINIPDFLVGYAAKLGIEKGTAAEKANIILNEHINRRAKSYGGAITESDRESATGELGKSTQGKLFALKRLNQHANDSVVAAVNGVVPGYAQSTIDLFLGEAARTPGVRAAPSLRPR